MIIATNQAYTVLMKWIVVTAIILTAAPIYAQHTKGACADGKVYQASNGESVEDDGTIGNPPHGWVGYTNTGDPIPGMVIELLTFDGKTHIASATTDASGRFSFPKLKNGTYYLIGTKTGYYTIRNVLHLSGRSNAIVCLVDEAE